MTVPEQLQQRLHALVARALQSQGVIPRMQAELRAYILNTLLQEPQELLFDTMESAGNTEGQYTLILVKDLLEYYKLEHTLAAFNLEAGLDQVTVHRENLAMGLRLSDDNSQPLVNQLLHKYMDVGSRTDTTGEQRAEQDQHEKEHEEAHIESVNDRDLDPEEGTKFSGLLPNENEDTQPLVESKFEDYLDDDNYDFQTTQILPYYEDVTYEDPRATESKFKYENDEDEYDFQSQAAYEAQSPGNQVELNEDQDEGVAKLEQEDEHEKACPENWSVTIEPAARIGVSEEPFSEIEEEDVHEFESDENPELGISDTDQALSTEQQSFMQQEVDFFTHDDFDGLEDILNDANEAPQLDEVDHEINYREGTQDGDSEHEHEQLQLENSVDGHSVNSTESGLNNALATVRAPRLFQADSMMHEHLPPLRMDVAKEDQPRRKDDFSIPHQIRSYSLEAEDAYEFVELDQANGFDESHKSDPGDEDDPFVQSAENTPDDTQDNEEDARIHSSEAIDVVERSMQETNRRGLLEATISPNMDGEEALGEYEEEFEEFSTDEDPDALEISAHSQTQGSDFFSDQF